MKSLCLYFQVHQPLRLRPYRFFDIGLAHNYYDDYQNHYLIHRIADRCYLPMNRLLLDLMRTHKDFRVSFSISGETLDQFSWYAPEVLESFQALAQTGQVEFICETYAHGLSSISNVAEFESQVSLHKEKLKHCFGVSPRAFRNTELIYSDEIGELIYKMGFETVLTEGAKHILGWKSPNLVYCNALQPKLKVLLRNYQLSDDIGFRFLSNGGLKAHDFVNRISKGQPTDDIVNLFMDYETFGEHLTAETGIFDFFKDFVKRVLSGKNLSFTTPSEAVKTHKAVAPIHIPFPISWADEERDLSAWLGNDLQIDAFTTLYNLRSQVVQTDDAELLKDWRFLQTSDHFYYMSTKWRADGQVHSYFRPYDSPYDAYINYMNILADFELRVRNYLDTNNKTKNNKTKNNSPKSTIMEQNKPAKKAVAKKPTVKKAAPAKKAVAPKAAPAKKAEVAKPVAKKAAPAKKVVAAKPAAKKAAPAKKVVAAKPAAKKAAPAKKVVAAKPVAKKAAPAKKVVAAKPAAKKAAPAKKVVAAKPAAKKAAPAKKVVAAKPVAKTAVAAKKVVAAKPVAKKAAPAKKVVTKKAPVKK